MKSERKKMHSEKELNQNSIHQGKKSDLTFRNLLLLATHYILSVFVILWKIFFNTIENFMNYIEKERRMNDKVDQIFLQQKDGKIDQERQQHLVDGDSTTSSEDSGVQDDGSDNSFNEIICKLESSIHKPWFPNVFH